MYFGGTRRLKCDLNAKFEFISDFMPFQDNDPNFRLGR